MVPNLLGPVHYRPIEFKFYSSNGSGALSWRCCSVPLGNLIGFYLAVGTTNGLFGNIVGSSTCSSLVQGCCFVSYITGGWSSIIYSPTNTAHFPALLWLIRRYNREVRKHVRGKRGSAQQ